VASLAGVAVGGLLQETGREPNGRPRMEMIDIASGHRILISQNLGGDSKACCIDPGGVATASGYLRSAIERYPDLLVINKFSGLEAKGGGLRAEFLDALAGGIAVLTGLSERHRESFEAMTQGAGTYLPANLAALNSWWAATARPARDLPAG